jgi:hypothetical protein
MTMKTNFKMAATALAAALACVAGPAGAQVSDGVIKIGVMNDMSGLSPAPDRSSPRAWRSRTSAPPRRG